MGAGASNSEGQDPNGGGSLLLLHAPLGAQGFKKLEIYMHGQYNRVDMFCLQVEINPK